MSIRVSSVSKGLLNSVGLASLLAVGVASNDASACGGCFHGPPPQDTMTTVVSGHRMAVSVSTTQTVLWDQVQYTGSPKDFAWVLPVKPGARIELSTDAWFEALDAATSTRVTAPQQNCGFNSNGNPPVGDDFTFDDGNNSGCGSSPGGCGSSDDFATPAAGDFGTGANGASVGVGGGGAGAPPPPPPVTVVHEGTVGPYETVTLHANDPNALPKWLGDHGYLIDADVKPIIDAYTTEGFDFIALRLAPAEGVQQMKPVRVVSPGASPTLPLRMVASGTGASVAITLFTIGEGRWAPKNFPGATIDPLLLNWDFANDSSNYASLRSDALAQNQGRTWLTAFALKGSLLSPLSDATGNPIALQLTDGTTANTIADAYVAQGYINAETAGSVTQCVGVLDGLASSSDVVVDTCAEDGGGSGGATSTSGAGGATSTSGAGGSGGATSTSGAGGAGGVGGATSTSGAGGAGGATTGSGGASGVGGAASSSGTGAGGGSPICGNAGPNQTAAKDLACGSLDDVAVALTGMHPVDVWITRLEAQLPRAALSADLILEAAPTQSSVSASFVATKATNNSCPLAGALLPPSHAKPTSPSDKHRRDRGMTAIMLLALALAIARRAARPRFVHARANAPA